VTVGNFDGTKAILFVSYGRMAAVYPSAGSAYTYVGRTINPHFGFLIGWAMLLDYMLQPLLGDVWVSVALESRYITRVPYPLIALVTVELRT
jgi:putrescine importer